jgi:hypothetical protein
MADAAGSSAEGAIDTPQDLTIFVQNLLDQMVLFVITHLLIRIFLYW